MKGAARATRTLSRARSAGLSRVALFPRDGLEDVLVRALPGDRRDRAIAADQVRQAALVALPLSERLRRIGVRAAVEVADEGDAALLLAAVIEGAELKVGIALVGPQRDLLARLLVLDRHVIRRGRLLLVVEVDVLEVVDRALLDLLRRGVDLEQVLVVGRGERLVGHVCRLAELQARARRGEPAARARAPAAVALRRRRGRLCRR